MPPKHGYEPINAAPPKQLQQQGVRIELPYTETGEALLKKWLSDARSASGLHDESGYHFKKLHRKYALPPVSFCRRRRRCRRRQ